ncbi:DUF6231 family protein [Acinetobacter nectaris]|uniref:DUF6231 family protein n=1 Tax=Acinetobacter nectaris TaxID=1219382 RepID=UPI001F37EF85|nr:DUF6231 family protein [Acinetobacter nectaris]MCF9033982.1 hypothetical protein [Acinetobacter nectaris]
MSEQNVIASLLDDLTQMQSLKTALCIGQDIAQYDLNKKIQWQYFNASDILSLPFTQRYDLGFVVFSDDLNRHSQLERGQIIVKLRDLWAKHVVVIAPQGDDAFMRSLGLTRIVDDALQDSQQTLWQFNILSYKNTPDWLNSKFWANPENWNKFRW